MIQPAQVPHGPLHVLIDSTGLQVYGAGQWLEAKHGAKSRRTWRKLHLAVDAASGMIVAQTLTDQDVDDPSQVGSLLDQIDDPIVQVTADGAYDGAPTYQTIAQHGDGIEVVIPPRATAVPSGELDPPTQRDRHLAMIAERGRLAWPGLDRLRPTVLSRNDNGPLQDTDRAAATSPRLCRPTDRSCHRRGGAKPDVGGRTPGFCPPPAGHRITAWGWCHLALRLEVHQHPVTPDGYRVMIRRSKTDQEGEGQDIAIPRGYRIRPVEHVQAWLAAIGDHRGAAIPPRAQGRQAPGRGIDPAQRGSNRAGLRQARRPGCRQLRRSQPTRRVPDIGGRVGCTDLQDDGVPVSVARYLAQRRNSTRTFSVKATRELIRASLVAVQIPPCFVEFMRRLSPTNSGN
jgi:hypothetical protein